MSDPRTSLPLPESFGQHQTLFVSGGLKAAILVTSVNGVQSQRKRRFENAQAALRWCEVNSVMMVFTPGGSCGGN